MQGRCYHEVILSLYFIFITSSRHDIAETLNTAKYGVKHQSTNQSIIIDLYYLSVTRFCGRKYR